MSRLRAILIWTVLVLALVVPVAAAAASPLLAWRDPVYIVAGFAGIVAMALLLLQPLLIGGYLPGLSPQRFRLFHLGIGGLLIMALIVHVAGLWITSPPDVVDALLFVSPTPFSVWGVVAMWAVLITALLASLRKVLRMQPNTWRIVHTVLALVIVLGSIVHAMLIVGTMETISKTALCAFVLLATLKVIAERRFWMLLKR